MIEKAKLLLRNENSELVEKYYKILQVWPDKNMVQKVIQELGYKTVRYIGPQTVVAIDFVPNRITIIYDENNKIRQISEN